MPASYWEALRTYKQGSCFIEVPHSAKAWAARNGWKGAPFFGFKKWFVQQMMESEEKFLAASKRTDVDFYLYKDVSPRPESGSHLRG